MRIALDAMSLDLPKVAGHPNRQEFRGLLTTVECASDRPPSGARGHRVLLAASAAEKALPSLLGMAVDYAPGLDRHDARRKIGIITDAELKAHTDGSHRLKVAGYLYGRDFPEVVREIKQRGKRELGMSYEIADVRVADIDQPVWTVTDFAFTGAAVLKRDKAAYQNTWVELVSWPQCIRTPGK